MQVEAQLAEAKAALDRATFGKIEQASKQDQARRETETGQTARREKDHAPKDTFPKVHLPVPGHQAGPRRCRVTHAWRAVWRGQASGCERGCCSCGHAAADGGADARADGGTILTDIWGVIPF